MNARAELPPAGYARSGRRSGAAWPWALSGIGLGFAILAACYGSTALHLLERWRTSTTYAYAWAVLPSLAYVLWHRRRRLASVPLAPSFTGILATGACGLVWLIADLANLAVAREAAFLAATIGLVLAATGWKIFRQLAPSLALLLLLVPTGDILIPPLKWLTVHAIATASALAAIPHSVDGYVIYVGINRYVVVDDCAGLPMILACTFLALTFGLLAYRTAWKIALFAVLGVLCGIAANGLRALSIVAVDSVQGTQMDLSSHAYFDWVALALALGVLFAVLTRITPEAGGHDGAPARVDEAVGPRCFVAVSCAALLAASIPQLALGHIARHDSSGALRQSDIALPAQLAQWTRHGEPHAWRPAPRIPILHDAARYMLDEREIAVFVAASDVASRKVTGYSIDLVGPGAWREGKRDVLRGCTAGGCSNINVIELLRRDSPDIRRVYYLYAIDGAYAATALTLQLRLAWARLLGARPTARLIALESEGRTVLRTDEIVKLFDALRRQSNITRTTDAGHSGQTLPAAQSLRNEDQRRAWQADVQTRADGR